MTAGVATAWEPPHLLWPGWRLVERGMDGEKYLNDHRQLSLIWSVAVELDGRTWLHVSVASPNRLPSYSDMVDAKEWIVGTSRYAYTVIPERSKHVNIHPNALHLWAPIDGGAEPLPDFTHGGGSI